MSRRKVVSFHLTKLRGSTGRIRFLLLLLSFLLLHLLLILLFFLLLLPLLHK
jgi:hypothetical protein